MKPHPRELDEHELEKGTRDKTTRTTASSHREIVFPILLSHTTVQILMCGTRGSWDARNLVLGISDLSDGKESTMLKTPVGKSFGWATPFAR